MYCADIKAPDLRTIDMQIRRLESQVNHLDSHLGQMCTLFSSYVRKTRDVGNKGDRLVREISRYADAQTPLSLQHCIKQFARQLAAVQDCRHASVDRLDTVVVEPLRSFGVFMRRNRDALKATQCAREKVAKQESRLRLRHMAERKADVAAAIVEVARSARQLKETIEDVRIQEIKKILSDFTVSEMSFHAKALELYTVAYRRLQGADEDDDQDLDVFRSGFLNPPQGRPESRLLRTRPRSRLGATQLSEGEEEEELSGTSQHWTASTLMTVRNWYPGQHRGQEEEEEEDEDDDEDDEEEDDNMLRTNTRP